MHDLFLVLQGPKPWRFSWVPHRYRLFVSPMLLKSASLSLMTTGRQGLWWPPCEKSWQLYGNGWTCRRIPQLILWVRNVRMKMSIGWLGVAFAACVALSWTHCQTTSLGQTSWAVPHVQLRSCCWTDLLRRCIAHALSICQSGQHSTQALFC